ncbi:hypothetical protein ZWY2020_037794 [Hordeum vulgare]|nr:hypothetical protein ZWY2020_037794 [Hordeum vulgare]
MPLCLVMTGGMGMGARLRRAPFVRRMMVMAGSLDRVDGRARSPLFLALPTAGWLPGARIESVVLAGPSPVVTDLGVLDGLEVLGGSSPIATTTDDLEFTEVDVLIVGMEVCPSSSSCSLGVVCYSLALGSPDRAPPPPLDLVPPVVTPEAAGSKARGEASPVVCARQSARLSQSRLLLDVRVPTIQEKATLRAAAHDLSPGNSTLPPAPSRSAFRFSILGCESLSHLAEVATDSGNLFRGEKGSILEQISTICTKEKLEGALAEARANAARGEPSS